MALQEACEQLLADGLARHLGGGEAAAAALARSEPVRGVLRERCAGLPVTVCTLARAVGARGLDAAGVHAHFCSAAAAAEEEEEGAAVEGAEGEEEEGETEYEITLRTGASSGAGTDARVWLQLLAKRRPFWKKAASDDEARTSGWVRLPRALEGRAAAGEEHTAFQRGKDDSFRLRTPRALGEVVAVQLAHDGSGLGPAPRPPPPPHTPAAAPHLALC